MKYEVLVRPNCGHIVIVDADSPTAAKNIAEEFINEAYNEYAEQIKYEMSYDIYEDGVLADTVEEVVPGSLQDSYVYITDAAEVIEPWE